MSLDPGVPDDFDASLNIRLHSLEKQKVADDAQVAGMSMSDVVRYRLNGTPIVSSLNYEMINSVRKAVGYIKHLHNESNGMYSDDTRAAINALTDLAKFIIEDKKSIGTDGAGR